MQPPERLRTRVNFSPVKLYYAVRLLRCTDHFCLAMLTLRRLIDHVVMIRQPAT